MHKILVERCFYNLPLNKLKYNSDEIRFALSQIIDKKGMNSSSWSLKSGKSRNFLTEFMSGRAKDITVGALHDLLISVDIDIKNFFYNIDRGNEEKKTNELRELRLSLQLSQKEFARIIDISINQLYFLEKSFYLPLPLAVKNKIEEKFGFKITNNQNSKKALTDIIEGMTDKECEDFLNTLYQKYL